MAAGLGWYQYTFDGGSSSYTRLKREIAALAPLGWGAELSLASLKAASQTTRTTMRYVVVVGQVSGRRRRLPVMRTTATIWTNPWGTTLLLRSNDGSFETYKVSSTHAESRHILRSGLPRGGSKRGT